MMVYSNIQCESPKNKKSHSICLTLQHISTTTCWKRQIEVQTYEPCFTYSCTAALFWKGTPLFHCSATRSKITNVTYLVNARHLKSAIFKWLTVNVHCIHLHKKNYLCSYLVWKNGIDESLIFIYYCYAQETTKNDTEESLNLTRMWS